MNDLVRWLGEQLDEDERIARAASGEEWGAVVPSQPYVIFDVAALKANKTLETVGRVAAVERAEDRAHIAVHDPARVLREIEAKRKLIAQGGPFCTSNCDDPDSPPMDPDTNWTTPLEHHFDCAAYEAAKVLALPYANRPGYEESWRP
jgi:hypothetical protein